MQPDDNYIAQAMRYMAQAYVTSAANELEAQHLTSW